MKILKWTLAVLVGMAVLGALLGGGDTTKTIKTSDNARGENGPVATAEEDTKPSTIAASPEADYKLACAYELGDFGESGDPKKGYRFTAGGTINNTGNIGIRVRVTYKWQRLGQAPLIVKMTYRVRRNEERDVATTVPTSQDQISAHQDSPGHGECKPKVSIISTFGKAA